MRSFVICCAIFLMFSLSAVAQKKSAPKQKPAIKNSTAKPKPTPTTPVSQTKPTTCPGSSLTDDEVAQLVTLHNNVRRDLRLPEMKWDCKAAAIAQQWANRGVFEHRSNSNFGENIFVAQNTNESVVSGFTKWMNERDNWNNSLGQCVTSKVCTHYTQIVWKTTRAVGCGINRNNTGKWRLMFVCNYDPAGNNKRGPAY